MYIVGECCFKTVATGSFESWMSPLEHSSIMRTCHSGKRENYLFITCGEGLLQNSNVKAIGWIYSNENLSSKISPFECVAVKKPNSDPGSHLLYTLQFKFDIHSFVMNEIAFNGIYSSIDDKNNRSVTVLNFANFGFAERKSTNVKENPEDNENFKMKIIYDRCVETYPCY